MKNFSTINREYVNPMDLNTLGKTYNTLEQGHKEAVKAASDLEIAMSSLDLNPAEAAWRQSKLGEIRQTISDNTTYGNAYTALDDIITKSGNLASDQGMIGRLQAQKDFKTYQTQLDSRNDIGEDMKEMFRERNPYSYADKIDEKTNQVIGSTKWEPKSRPVSTIDHFKLMSNALNIAAKESGGGSSVTFLDANGKPTRDASKSANGEMYMKTSSSYDRLSPDKIRAAIDAAISATPGAMASLEQDYDLAKWNYNKEVKLNGDKPIIKDGVTDKFGNILPLNAFIENKVTPFVKAATYNNVRSDTQLGTALSTMRAKQAQDALTASANAANPIKNLLRGGSNSVGTVETDVDNYATTLLGKQTTNKGALDIIKKYTPDQARSMTSVSDFIAAQTKGMKNFGPGIAVNEYIKKLEKQGITMSPNERSIFRTAVKSYYQYDTERKKMEQNLNETDKSAMRFNANNSNGEYKAGDSKWDDQIIKANNKIWSNNDQVTVSMSPDLTNAMKAKYGVTNLSEAGFKVRQIDGDAVVIFDPEDRNALPKFLSELDEVDDKTVGASWRGIKNVITGKGRNKDYVISGVKGGTQQEVVVNKNKAKQYIENFGRLLNEPTNPGNDNLLLAAREMKNAYNSGISKAANVQKSAGVNKGVVSMEGFGKDNFRSIELQAQLERGELDQSDYNARVKEAKEDLDIKLATSNFDAGLLLQADEANMFKKVDKPYDMQQLVSYMMTNNPTKVIRNAIVPTGITDARRGDIPLKGYIMEFTVPKGSPFKDYENKRIKVFYGGGLEEGLESDPAISTGVVVRNIYNTSKATRAPASVLNVSKHMGNTDVTFRDGNPVINFGGETVKTSQDGAIKYMENLYTLDNLKSMYLNKTAVDQKMYNQALGQVIRNISDQTGKDFAIVEGMVANYILNENEQN